MKRQFIVALAIFTLVLGSCVSGSDSKPKPADSISTGTSSLDSAANNEVVPPSAAPGNAGNSSLADTTYKSDTSKKK